MNKLKIIIIVLALLILGIYLLFRFLNSPKFVATLIRKNSDVISIILVKNDTFLINQNAAVMRPLASTVKTIIAIEFAEQVAAQKINPAELINLDELNKYYIKNTDGNAHPDWLKYMEEKKRITNHQVTLEQVAYGMLKFSSNANTEFLQDKLGLDYINERIKILGLPHHQKLFYLASSLYVADKMDTISNEQLQAECNTIHNQLKNNQTPMDSANFEKVLALKNQKKWSDRLPAATAMEYYTLMSRMNKRNYFTPAVQTELDKLMEWPMENEDNKKWAKRLGAKGGSTLWILNDALYAETLDGNHYEFILFCNSNKEDNDNFIIQNGMDKFLLTLFNDPKKSRQLIEIISAKPVK